MVKIKPFLIPIFLLCLNSAMLVININRQSYVYAGISLITCIIIVLYIVILRFREFKKLNKREVKK